MNTTSFWNDNFPRPADLPVADELPTQVDVAIIGGGYTGLSAARTLRKASVSVAVLERNHIGWGASSRNGGITGCGLKKGTPAVFKDYGEKYGRAFWQAGLDALDLVVELSEKDGIDCDLEENGDLCVAYKPSHFEGFKKKIAWHKENLGHELELIPPGEIQHEIGSSAYFGGLVDHHGTGIHPSKLVYNLAKFVAAQGAILVENTGATKIEKLDQGYSLETPRGYLEAKEIILATNGYTDNLSPKLNRKSFPVGSYSIVTEPLSDELRMSISPKGRMFWDSKWFLNYFRVTPDGRLLWGGRNNLSTTLDLANSAAILHAEMLRAFPQLAGINVTHTWTGQLGLTFDLMPNIGRLDDGIHYALGYGGHGLHTALYLGREIAQIVTGEKTSSPFMEIPHQTHFFYRDKAWFLPFAAYYYRFRDAIS
jgi:glycine/D-amino acid oxidase-like deaminating enzyme